MYISQYELIFHSSTHKDLLVLWVLINKHFAVITSQKKGDPTQEFLNCPPPLSLAGYIKRV